MEKKQLKKLKLGKTVIAKLTDDEQSNIKGGGVFTTSGNCTGFLCCNTNNPTQPQNTCGTCDTITNCA